MRQKWVKRDSYSKIAIICTIETTEHSLYVLDFGTYRLCSFITFLALKILVCLHIISFDHSSFILLKSIPLYFHLEFVMYFMSYTDIVSFTDNFSLILTKIYNNYKKETCIQGLNKDVSFDRYIVLYMTF